MIIICGTTDNSWLCDDGTLLGSGRLLSVAGRLQGACADLFPDTDGTKVGISLDSRLPQLSHTGRACLHSEPFAFTLQTQVAYVDVGFIIIIIRDPFHHRLTGCSSSSPFRFLSLSPHLKMLFPLDDD